MKNILLTALLTIAMAAPVLMPATGPAMSQEKTGQQGARRAQNVIVTPARTENFVDRVEALGTLRANETVVLTATVTETVEAVNFEDGQRVEKGHILIEMTGGQEKAELDAEQATVAEARAQVERMRPLVESGAASRSDLDVREREYKTAQARLDAVRSRLGDRVIAAPFSGVLGMRNISVGAVVQPGTRITSLDDDSVMKLDFSVPSVFLSALTPGLEIVATSRAFETRRFKGRIASVDSQIDPVTRSISVRAIIPNEDRALKPGLLMSVEILKNPREAVVVPEEAVVPEARKNFVYVVDGTTARKRPVTLGAREPGKVEVVEGLRPGEKVVTHGTMTISDGAAINIVAEDAGGQSIPDIIRQKEAQTGEAPESQTPESQTPESQAQEPQAPAPSTPAQGN